MTTRSAATAAAVLTGAVTVVASAGSASASTVWQRVAACESGGNWSINTGNGFYGGLQFTASTWAGYGGTQYASRADLASPAQQIAIARKVQASQGWGAWPVCSRKAGAYGSNPAAGGTVSTSASTSASTSVSTSTRHVAVHVQSEVRTPTVRSAVRHSAYVQTALPRGTEAYRVRSGDTLSSIAQREGHITWQTLWAMNRATVSNPNFILVGQVLRLP